MAKLWRIGEEELKYIKEAIEGGLTGSFNDRLEEEFAKKFGMEFAVGVNSGTSALHCCIGALGVGPGDEVITTPLTFAAPAFAVLQQGAKPVFADVDEDTFTIDPDDIRRKITNRTKAIIPVALYGLPADMDPIMEIAEEHNLKVIEDNAQCFLGRCKGRLAGTIGHASIFSFERSKHMTTGNGGMIITNDEALAEKIRKFSVLGYSTLTAKKQSYKTSKDTIQHPDFKRHVMAGFNYRLPEVCAAMALAQLEKIDMLVEKRQRIAQLYSEAVEDCNWIIPQKVPKNFANAYWTYAALVEKDWLTFRRIFLEEGGERFYAAWSIVYLEPVFSEMGYKRGICPVAEKLQPKLVQLKTNFEDSNYVKEQATALRRTIEKMD